MHALCFHFSHGCLYTVSPGSVSDANGSSSSTTKSIDFDDIDELACAETLPESDDEAGPQEEENEQAELEIGGTVNRSCRVRISLLGISFSASPSFWQVLQQ